MKNKIFSFIVCLLLFIGVYNVLGETKDFDYNYVRVDTIEVIDQKQLTDCGYGCPFFKNIWIAQGFTPTLESLTKVELKLFKAGNPTNTLTVSVRNSLTGSDLTSITLEGVNIPPYSVWVEFDFDDIGVVPGVEYFIIIRTPGGSFFDYYCCLFDINNPYDGGETWGSLNAGGTWSLIEEPDYPDPDGCFKTYGLDESPTDPEINGPLSGKIGNSYTYTIYSTDPEYHDIYYFVDWGDSTNTGWMGPYNSGEEISFDHSWENQGSYIIKAKSKDIYDAESQWGNLEISMPKEKSQFTILYQFFLFLQQLLNLL
jgi:hypothetical protein